MIEHMVWAKFHPGVSARRREELLTAIAELKDRIDVVVDLKVGPAVGGDSGYTHGWTVTLAGMDDLASYMDHPAHQAIGPAVAEAAEMVKLDVEFPAER
ncbi:MAG: Dabb family protein [Phycisphaeraceae bacterium]